MSNSVVTQQDLEMDCRVLEASLRQLGVTPEDIDPHRPGSAQNQDTSARGWLRLYTALQRKHALLMERQSVPEDDDLLVAALRAEPVRVLQGTLGVERGDELKLDRVMAVYPKSFDALMEMQKRDDLIGWLAVRYLFLRERSEISHNANLLEFSQRVLDELTYQYQVLVWIATAPGCGLPFDDMGVTRPEVPEAIRKLDVFEIVEVVRAHSMANAMRLRVLRTMLTPDKSPTDRVRPTWAMFFANAAMDLKRPAQELMRDLSLVEVLAQLQLHAVANKDARDDAKAASEAA